MAQAEEAASATAGGKALDMVQVGVRSTVVAVAAIWALGPSGAGLAEVEEVAPVPVASTVAPEVVVFGVAQSKSVLHCEFAPA